MPRRMFSKKKAVRVSTEDGMDIRKAFGMPKFIPGHVPDTPDKRDRKYKAPRFKLLRFILRVLPPVVDLRDKMPPVYNQGDLGSCVTNAIIAAIQYLLGIQGMVQDMLSRLMLYYEGRKKINTLGEDSGMMIRDGVKISNAIGICHESTWPYLVDKFKEKPPASAYKEAEEHQTLVYARVEQNLYDIKSRLAQGFPVVFGISLYDSFLSESVACSGVIPMPDIGRERLQGGHAILAVGYIEKRKCLIIRNSWGAVWGIQGYFLLPYEYALDPDLACDFWTIELVEGELLKRMKQLKRFKNPIV